jgi:class 3 adenylate cyclase
MGAVVVTRSVDLAAPPERIWPFVSDTDRFNRLLGMNEVRYRPIEAGAKTSARFVGETRTAGFKLVYEERPFEWVRERAFSVHRRMLGGPVDSMTLRCTLEKTRATDRAGAVEGGTRLTVRLEITPRATVLTPIAWINARQFAARFVGIGPAIDAHLVRGEASPYEVPATPADPERIQAAVAALRERSVAPELAERIGAFVRDGADADVVRLRPFALADEWGLDRREVLRAFLHAVPIGLCELRWGLVCPSCLGSSEQARSLEEIRTEGHCQLCDITYDLDLDRAVEATFLPHPAVRRVPEGMFCMSGPARFPHVLVQASVDPQGSLALEVPDAPGRYRLFVRGGATATLEVEPAGAKVVEATLASDAVRPAHLHAAPGAELRVTSACDDGRHVKIERLAFASTAATAHVVSTLEEFRSLFSKELLKRGTPLKVARAAILFSDLTGSTALYTRVGDAAAFRLVDDHFDVLRAVVAEHDGVLIKTMGDAVMAAFVDARQCARAATDALARFEKFRAAQEHGDLVGLKVGLYSGACYVVTANGALDYFGQTVNVASRVQHLAGSGELVVPAEVYAELDAEEQAALVVRERFEARVKGVEHPLALVRAGHATSVR